MNPIIEIEHLSKDYEPGFWKKKKVRALDDISLTVSSGQIFGFLGGNGYRLEMADHAPNADYIVAAMEGRMTDDDFIEAIRPRIHRL